MTKVAPKEFIDWLNAQMEKNGWGVRETARRANISHAPISYVLSGDQPSFDTCVALAKAFDVPVLTVLSMANLIDLPQNYSPTQAEWDHVYSQLDTDAQQELLALARFKIDKNQRKKHDTGPLPHLNNATP